MASYLAFKYGKHEWTGQSLQEWIEGRPSNITGENCPIQHCKLRFRDLGAWKPVTRRCTLDLGNFGGGRAGAEMVLVPKIIQNKAKDIGIKISNDTFFKIVAAERTPGTNPNEAWRNYWEGIVAPGALFVEQMFRKSGPFASELSLIVYKEYFSIDSLKHIFLVNILNEDTKRFVLTELYTPKNRLSWPDSNPRM